MGCILDHLPAAGADHAPTPPEPTRPLRAIEVRQVSPDTWLWTAWRRDPDDDLRRPIIARGTIVRDRDGIVDPDELVDHIQSLLDDHSIVSSR